MLKTLDTIGNCHLVYLNICIQEQTCENLSSIGRWSCKIIMKEKTPLSHKVVCQFTNSPFHSILSFLLPNNTPFVHILSLHLLFCLPLWFLFSFLEFKKPFCMLDLNNVCTVTYLISSYLLNLNSSDYLYIISCYVTWLRASCFLAIWDRWTHIHISEWIMSQWYPGLLIRCLLYKGLPRTIWHGNCLYSLKNSNVSRTLCLSTSLYQTLFKSNL